MRDSPYDSFKTLANKLFKLVFEPPSLKTAVEYMCCKCGDQSFRSRNALFDYIYSNTCSSPKGLKQQFFSIIIRNDTPVKQIAFKTPVRDLSSSWLSRRLVSSTAIKS